jgi:gamma-glutamyl-gamma-aminobutyraldehyde dehydrogenase
LAVMKAIDAGKPITDCIEIDIPETASCIRWHGEAQDNCMIRSPLWALMGMD